MPDMVKTKNFADKVANYMYIDGNLETMSATEAVKQTILFLASDIGATQEFLRVLELDVDLYEPKSLAQRFADVQAYCSNNGHAMRSNLIPCDLCMGVVKD